MMTNVLANSVLSAYFTGAAHWLGLHTTDPTAAGLAGGEIAGGSYVRQQINWTAPSARTVANNNTLTFLNLPAATVNYLAIWTAQSGGSIYYVVPVVPGLTFVSGGTFVLPLSDLTLTLQ
jgi:hypothetical protein